MPFFEENRSIFSKNSRFYNKKRKEQYSSFDPKNDQRKGNHLLKNGQLLG